MPEVTLANAPVGVSLTLVGCIVNPALRTRLAMLGLRPGARVQVLGNTPGKGRVVFVAGSRIAMDRSVLAALTARAVPA